MRTTLLVTVFLLSGVSCNPETAASGACPDSNAPVCEPAEDCGNGALDSGEECDDGNLENGDGCDSHCQYTECGDGTVQPTEQCDPESTPYSGPCTNECKLEEIAVCGDGKPQWGEQCDDGNLVDDDGCDADCIYTIADLQAGHQHSCILTRSGAIKCWGLNDTAQLGNGTLDAVGYFDRPSDWPFINFGRTVRQLSLGSSHSCVLFDDGGMKCWGYGGSGQLGYGDDESVVGDDEDITRIPDINVGGSVVYISAGVGYTCAVLDGGKLKCWGFNDAGQLGYGNTNEAALDKTPAELDFVDVGGGVIQVSAGFDHTCALLDGGQVKCWGEGEFGKLGYGNTESIGDNETPGTVGVVSVLSQEEAADWEIDSIDVGSDHTCALIRSRTASEVWYDFGEYGYETKCWGRGEWGALGRANTENVGDVLLPSSVGFIGTAPHSQYGLDRISVGADHNCATLGAGNEVQCWGFPNEGRLGYGNEMIVGDDESPGDLWYVETGDDNASADKIAAGGQHSCILTSNGIRRNVRCWGSNYYGQLGYGTGNVNVGDDETPIEFYRDILMGSGNVPID